MSELSTSANVRASNWLPNQSRREWLNVLTPTTMLGELPSFEVTVSPEVLTSIVDRQLGTSTDLPGVVIAEGGKLYGMISRPVLFAQLSRPFGQELYLKRPVRLLLEAEHPEPLVLPSDMLVSEAAHTALQRTAEQVYEPVVIRTGGEYRLLDSHTLLIAQSRLLALANETIRSQADLAEAANHSKSLFLANMSHEIRTPLTAILGFAENILDIHCTANERTAAVETILKNGHHLLQLINDILDLSKIEAGHLDVERIKFSPGEVVADVISSLRFRADSKRIGLSLVYEGSIPSTIESDPTRLRQILMNLISNAIKFTERGEVVVRLKLVDSQGHLCSTSTLPKDVRLQCDVIDSGIGISNEQLSRLFSPFMQADESMARRFGGTGLGLSISRRLARMLGGDITVTSDRNTGSTFTMQIRVELLGDITWYERPSSIGKPMTPMIRSSDVRLNGRILLAEDGPDNQQLISSFLRRHGATVTIVDDGLKAIDAATTSLKDDNPFHVVLMDMQMPTMDGYTATRELRLRGWTGPIIALTANAMQGDRQRCLQAGCNEFAVKPIVRAELLEMIQSFMTGTSTKSHSFQEQKETSPPAEIVFNPETALARAGGSEELMRDIAEIFVRIAPEWLDSFERHMREQDHASARRIAHSLKSSTDNVGGQQATGLLSKLEESIASNSLSEIDLLWPDCHKSVLELLKEVQSFLRKHATASGNL